ncbi:hypothetical protein SPRG_09090 [Saprolegnia parasitica CBS 223.65]|uniref:Uncharacterized protein n=1 Tax=Saprolegnia parasitica (strain CBS 223.65) TaxID=695850 RepID=A0A067C9G2_SAPPC|nr:hypothetical protein SPRG_09090 [Saprolegnia parasitica CBS 223.65]KDO25795.1 hypothetical protein SPRG_09090 [Saprolegnia parasitica CBS 223.65]|eukprot:XP_012203598.1 hypothetical protein SPRG_09090 [Saprolegnia parasitica CBS 223.65]
MDKEFFLWCAVYDNNATEVARLVCTGVNPNYCENELNVTPVHYATSARNLPMVSQLLVALVDVDIPDHTGATPLHTAATAGHVGLVQALLGANASVDRQANDGTTPWERARAGGHTEVAQLLFDRLLRMAVNAGNLNYAKQLLDAESHEAGRLPLHYAVQRKDPALLHLLLSDPSLDKNALDADGYSALARTAAASEDGCAWKLLRAGLVIRSADMTAASPLHLAAALGHTSILGMLLANPTTNLDAFDKNHCTALVLAVASNHVAAVEMLLVAGADTSIPFPNGATILAGAVRLGHHALAQTLHDRIYNRVASITAQDLKFVANGGIGAGGQGVVVKAVYNEDLVAVKKLAPGARRDAILSLRYEIAVTRMSVIVLSQDIS